MTTRDIWGLAAFLAICLGIAAVTGFVTAPNVAGWYQELAKPSFNPPNSLFAPVWTLLYIMIAVSGWLIWRATGFGPDRPLVIYGLQLALNFAWSFIFFGAHMIGLALADIVLLLIVIGWNIVAFWRIEPIAGLLLVPYFFWVSFATALNAAIWDIN